MNQTVLLTLGGDWGPMFVQTDDWRTLGSISSSASGGNCSWTRQLCAFVLFFHFNALSSSSTWRIRLQRLPLRSFLLLRHIRHFRTVRYSQLSSERDGGGAGRGFENVKVFFAKLKKNELEMDRNVNAVSWPMILLWNSRRNQRKQRDPDGRD